MRRRQYAYENFIVDDLKSYPYWLKALESIPEEIDTLNAEFTNIRAVQTDSTPVSGGTNKREEMLLSNIAKREELSVKLADTRRRVAIVDKMIDGLSRDEYLIIDRMYMHPNKGNVDRLCGELGYERSRVYELKDSVMLKLGKSRYGVLEV